MRQQICHHWFRWRLSPGQYQGSTWTNSGILLIDPLETNRNYTFSFEKMHLKMSYGKCRPFCLDLNVFIAIIHDPFYIPQLHLSIRNRKKVRINYTNAMARKTRGQLPWSWVTYTIFPRWLIILMAPCMLCDPEGETYRASFVEIVSVLYFTKWRGVLRVLLYLTVRNTQGPFY